MSTDLTSVFDLSWAEKLQLVEDLWDDLAAHPESVPELKEVERRRAEYLRNPGVQAFS